MFALRSFVLALLAFSALPCLAGETVLLDFTAPWCGPCQRMKPLVEQLAAAGYPVRQVNIDQRRDLAQRYRVTNIPCFVMVVDGVEVDREVGVVGYRRLSQMLAKAQVARAGERPRRVLGQSPDRRAPAGSASRSAANTASGSSAPSVPETPRATPSPPPVRENSSETRASLPPRLVSSSPRSASRDDLIARLTQSTVRLRVDDPNGHSYGTGTIIDARAGEALVVTCGHIFRDSQGQGSIEVALAGDDGRTFPARLISYDLKRDLGLVSFRPDGEVNTARVAAEGAEITTGQRVVNLGCNGGRAPTAVRSRISAVDKYLGPRNIEVAGAPVEGRSGGGLFDEQGRLIGVCFAADPRDNEGVYAHLESVHAELRRLGLMDVCAAAEPENQPATTSFATSPPRMPSEMPGGDAPRDESEKARPGLGSRVVNLSQEEEAALEEIANRSGDSEVICIIRPLSDPEAKSEILVLNRASAAFVDQLTEAARRQHQRQLTSLEVRRQGDAADVQARNNPGPTARGKQELADAAGWRAKGGARRY